MGQIIQTDDLKRAVDGNLQAYVNQVTGSYSRLFGRSPTFVTYYSQDLVEGSEDVNLGGVIQFVGPESPIRYRTVRNFPIYGVSEADLSAAYDEIRGTVSENVGGEAHVLPQTLEPVENDLFVIQHLEVALVFRVKQADPDRIEGRPYYKLQYFLDQIDPADLELQIIGRHAFEISNLGTDHSPILDEELALLLAEAEQVVERVRSSYWKAFYDRESGTLLLRDSAFGAVIHDRSVDLLVSKNDLLSGRRYLGSRVVRVPEYADRGVFDDVMYPETLCGAAERCAVPEAWGVTFAPARPMSPSSPFFAGFAVSGYLEAIQSGDLAADFFPGGPGLAAAVAADGDYPSGPILAGVAARCLSGRYRGTQTAALLRELLDAINDTRILADRANFYWLGPIVLLEVRRFFNQTLRTAN